MQFIQQTYSTNSKNGISLQESEKETFKYGYLVLTNLKDTYFWLS